MLSSAEALGYSGLSSASQHPENAAARNAPRGRRRRAGAPLSRNHHSVRAGQPGRADGMPAGELGGESLCGCRPPPSPGSVDGRLPDPGGVPTRSDPGSPSGGAGRHLSGGR